MFSAPRARIKPSVVTGVVPRHYHLCQTVLGITYMMHKRRPLSHSYRIVDLSYLVDEGAELVVVV
jgi:hypothetical protein